MMRGKSLSKSSLALLIALLSFTIFPTKATAQKVPDSGAQTLKLEVVVPPPQFQTIKGFDGRDYEKIELKSRQLYFREAGKPQLPYIKTFVQVPDEATEIKLQVHGGSGQSFKNKLIYPVPQEVIKEDSDGAKYVAEEFACDEASYQSSDVYPAELGRIAHDGKIRSVRIIEVHLFPYRYRAAEKTLDVQNTVSFSLQYSLTQKLEAQASSKTALISQQSGSTRKVGLGHFQRLLGATIINPSAALLEAGSTGAASALPNTASGSFAATSTLESEATASASRSVKYLNAATLKDATNSADYLIITHGDFFNSAELAAFAKYRARADQFSIAIAKVEDLYTAFPSATTERHKSVKAFTQHAYDNWAKVPSFLLLVGDLTRVPSYKLVTHTWGTEEYQDDDWFVYLNGPDDEWSDMAVGRFDVSSKASIANITEKITYHEQARINPGGSAFKTVFLQGQMGGGWDARPAYSEFRNDLLNRGFDMQLWSAPDTYGVNEICRSFTSDLLAIYGHGTPESIGLGSLNGYSWQGQWYPGNASFAWWPDYCTRNVCLDPDPIFDFYRENNFCCTDCPNGWNLNSYPIVITASCSTASLSWPYDSVAQGVVNARRSGAVAYYGATHLVYGDQSMSDITQAILDLNLYYLGEAIVESETVNRYTQRRRQILIGDPALHAFGYRRETGLADLGFATINESGELINVQYNNQTKKIDLSVNIENLGLGDAGSFDVEIYRGETVDADSLIGTINVPGLESGKTKRVSAEFSPLDLLGQLKLTVKLNPNKTVAESFYLNNQKASDVNIASLKLTVTPKDIILRNDPNFSVSITATDLVEERMSVLLSELPAGVSLDIIEDTPGLLRATLSGRMPEGQLVYKPLITVKTADQRIVSESLNIRLVVPTVSIFVNDQSIYPSYNLSFMVAASDPLGLPITLSASNLPQNASFDPKNGLFSWTPLYSQGGEHYVSFGASTAYASASKTIVITVKSITELTLEAPATQSVSPLDQLRFQVRAFDPEQMHISYSATNLPEGASFDPVTRLFSWTPSLGQQGAYTVTFHAATETHSTSAQTVITVNDAAPLRPKLNMLDYYFRVGLSHQSKIEVSGARGLPITVSVTGLPPGASLSEASGSYYITWVPGCEQVGEWPVTFRATNIYGTTEVQGLLRVGFTYEVGPLYTIKQGDLYSDQVFNVSSCAAGSYTISAEKFSAEQLPRGASIDPNTGVFTWKPDYDQYSYYDEDGNELEGGFGLLTLVFSIQVGDYEEKHYLDLDVIAVKPKWIKAPPYVDYYGDDFYYGGLIPLGQVLEFSIKVEGANGEPIRYWMDGTPPGATFNEETGTFRWLPRDTAAAASFRFNASNGLFTLYHDTFFDINPEHTPIAIGNRVFQDQNRNGRFDTGTERGIAKVPVELWVDLNGNGIFEPQGADAQTPREVMTDQNGRYYFGGMTAQMPQIQALSDEEFLRSPLWIASDKYFVRIPAKAFNGINAPLSTMKSSPGNSINLAEDETVGEKGIDDANYLANGIVSIPVSATMDTPGPLAEDATGLPIIYQYEDYIQQLEDQHTYLSVDFGFYRQQPTLARLGEIKAGWVDGVATISWKTLAEVGTLGFYLSRKEGANWVRINAQIIPASGGYSGATYELVDTNLPGPGTYLYKLEEIDLRGDRNVLSESPLSFTSEAGSLTGKLELQGFVGSGTKPLHSRRVTFTASGGKAIKRWEVELSNTEGSTFNFSLSDVPLGTTHLGAKTNWNLRRKVKLSSLKSGALKAELTGRSLLKAGDINNDNRVDGNDLKAFHTKYSVNGNKIQRTSSNADLNGDGKTDLKDLRTLMRNIGTRGDAN